MVVSRMTFEQTMVVMLAKHCAKFCCWLFLLIELFGYFGFWIWNFTFFSFNLCVKFLSVTWIDTRQDRLNAVDCVKVFVEILVKL